MHTSAGMAAKQISTTLFTQRRLHPGIGMCPAQHTAPRQAGASQEEKKKTDEKRGAPGALHDEAQGGELAGTIADERLVVDAAAFPVELALRADTLVKCL